MAVAEADVRALFPNDPSTTVVAHYITDAEVIVADVLASSGYASNKLDLITKYLAAHLYVLGQQEGGIFEEEIGESMEKRGSTFTLGQGLKLTRWGQMVLSVDTGKYFTDEASVNTSDKKSALFRVY